MTSTRFQRLLDWRCLLDDPPCEITFALAGLTDGHLRAHAAALDRALDAMDALERGAIANPDEQRMVGHYWLRTPALAPNDEISSAITSTVETIERLARQVHAGDVAPPEGGRFETVVVVGIGGSALGPMLAAEVLDHPGAPLAVHVLDNTDPDGIDRLRHRLGSLVPVLLVVTSKSGTTPETRNGMLELEAAFVAEGIAFALRAIAVTSGGSALAQRAEQQGWLAWLPMWDWVGGRTSELSAVGLLPAALQGADVHALLAGARAMDALTRGRELRANPAALMALWWYLEGGGRGERNMVVLPYKDRLLLLSRYLQLLVMESLGKRLDRQGNEVHQGLTVLGNKGSTDQHAFVQQLRDGRHDFFAVFVRVLEDRAGPSIEVDQDTGATSGDYLDGLLLGTREALAEAGRTSITITLQRLDERGLGALIALFERAVGLYAELIDVNGYHQPGVEAGKRAAAGVLSWQRALLGALDAQPRGVEELAERAGRDPAEVWPVLCRLAATRAEVSMAGAWDPRVARFMRR